MCCVGLKPKLHVRKWRPGIPPALKCCPSFSLSSISSFSGLSDTMVGAEMISPLFPFPFYGHELTEFYITTHGFLSLSPRLHDYIYKTQYIAPLRIKLDPSRSNSSTISLLSLPDRLTGFVGYCALLFRLLLILIE